jgi:subtilase family serine protease
LTTGTEQVWSSETSWTDSGGGISLYNFAIPSYQQTTGIINVNNGGSNTYRNAPDVSAAADFMYYTCYSGTCAGGYGGTSFASPLWAAFNALINQRSLGNNNGYVGFINPALYSIFLGPNYSSAFHDIITGTNAGTANSQCTAVSTPSACCTGLGTGSCTGVVNEWNAVTNYDLVTGGGSFKPGLIDLLGGLDTTPPTLSSATIGTNGTTLTLVLSEAVVNHTGFSVSPSNTLTYVSGSGSTTLVFTLTTTVYSGAMDTLSYSAGDVTDAASNPLATISGASITNNSTQTQGGTPSAPSSITGGIFTGKRQ